MPNFLSTFFSGVGRKLVEFKETSAGAGDVGKFPVANSAGKIDASWLPAGAAGPSAGLQYARATNGATPTTGQLTVDSNTLASIATIRIHYTDRASGNNGTWQNAFGANDLLVFTSQAGVAAAFTVASQTQAANVTTFTVSGGTGALPAAGGTDYIGITRSPRGTAGAAGAPGTGSAGPAGAPGNPLTINLHSLSGAPGEAAGPTVSPYGNEPGFLFANGDDRYANYFFRRPAGSTTALTVTLRWKASPSATSGKNVYWKVTAAGSSSVAVGANYSVTGANQLLTTTLSVITTSGVNTGDWFRLQVERRGADDETNSMPGSALLLGVTASWGGDALTVDFPALSGSPSSSTSPGISAFGNSPGFLYFSIQNDLGNFFLRRPTGSSVLLQITLRWLSSASATSGKNVYWKATAVGSSSVSSGANYSVTSANQTLVTILTTITTSGIAEGDWFRLEIERRGVSEETNPMPGTATLLGVTATWGAA
jgi:hypothetical protein